MKKSKASIQLFQSKAFHQLLLLIIPFLLYIQTTGFDFTYHDDDIIVLNNSTVLKHFDLQKIFFTDAWMMDKKIELYRPFQTFTYAIDYFFSGINAAGYHLHNVLIFCFGIQLLYLFLLTISVNERSAFFLSVLFSVHFLFAHTVSWIPARGDLYLFAFSIGSLLLFFLFLKKQKIIYSVGSSVLYFFALLSKESAIVLLPIIYIVSYLFWKPELKKPSFWLLLLLSILFTVLYLWMRQQSISPVVNDFTFEGFIYNLPIIPESVCKFFIPAFFSVMPTFNIIVTALGILLILIIGLSIFFLRQKINFNLIITGCIFFLLPVLPSLIYKPVFSGYTYDYLDHRMFFPGVGLLFISYAIFISIIKRQLPVSLFYIFIGVVCIITFYNTTNYRNYSSYYENAISGNPTSGLAFMNYGSSLARENKYPEALIKFNQAVKVMSDKSEPRMKLADSYYTLKDYPNMIIQCKALINENPKFAKSYYNMAVFFTDIKKNDSALNYVNRALKLDSKNADANFYKALVLRRIGLNDSALIYFSKTILLNKEYTLAYFQRGTIYGDKGNFTEALPDFDRYVNLNPTDGNGYFYRGQARCLTGNKEDGCVDFHEALNMGVGEAQSKIDYWCK